jgi:hypothetical protein
MKLVAETENTWKYELVSNEADVLVQLLRRFPLAELKPVKISKRDQDSKVVERETLLNESLAAHRKDLKRLAEGLASKLTRTGDVYSLTLNPEEREMLMQIFNDIRIGAWQSLGEPENLEMPVSAEFTEQVNWSLMNLVGYFEAGLIGED